MNQWFLMCLAKAFPGFGGIVLGFSKCDQSMFIVYKLNHFSFVKCSLHFNNTHRKQTGGPVGSECPDGPFIDDDLGHRKMLGVSNPSFPPVHVVGWNKIGMWFRAI